jgi:hypothetical protein
MTTSGEGWSPGCEESGARLHVLVMAGLSVGEVATGEVGMC